MHRQPQLTLFTDENVKKAYVESQTHRTAQTTRATGVIRNEFFLFELIFWQICSTLYSVLIQLFAAMQNKQYLFTKSVQLGMSCVRAIIFRFLM